MCSEALDDKWSCTSFSFLFRIFQTFYWRHNLEVMAEVLVWEDYLTIGLYFVVVLSLGIWVSSKVILLRDKVFSSDFNFYTFNSPEACLLYSHTDREKYLKDLHRQTSNLYSLNSVWMYFVMWEPSFSYSLPKNKYEYVIVTQMQLLYTLLIHCIVLL